MKQYLPWEINWCLEGQDFRFISNFIVLYTKARQLPQSEAQNAITKSYTISLGSIIISTSHLRLRFASLHFLSVFSTKRLQLGIFYRASAPCLPVCIIRKCYMARPKNRGSPQILDFSRILPLLLCMALEISCSALCSAYVLDGSQQSVLTFVK